MCLSGSSWSRGGRSESHCTVFFPCFYEAIRYWVRVYLCPIWSCVHLIELKRSHPSSKPGHIHSQIPRIRTWTWHSEDTLVPTIKGCPVGERLQKVWGVFRRWMVFCFWIWMPTVWWFQFMKFVLQFTYGVWCALTSVLCFQKNLNCLCL